jgi:aminoglycoside 6'-N-acetyltransferase I
MVADEIVVRPIGESDLEEWFRLRCILWDETPEAEHRSEMLDILDHYETQQVFVAENDGRLVGFLEASIRPFVEDCYSDRVGYLEGWYVEQPFRRKGIGAELVRAAEKWAKINGCAEMASDAELGNTISAEAHTKLGYEETSRLIHFRKEL